MRSRCAASSCLCWDSFMLRTWFSSSRSSLWTSSERSSSFRPLFSPAASWMSPSFSIIIWDTIQTFYIGDSIKLDGSEVFLLQLFVRVEDSVSVVLEGTHGVHERVQSGFSVVALFLPLPQFLLQIPQFPSSPLQLLLGLLRPAVGLLSSFLRSLGKQNKCTIFITSLVDDNDAVQILLKRLRLSVKAFEDLRSVSSCSTFRHSRLSSASRSLSSARARSASPCSRPTASSSARARCWRPSSSLFRARASRCADCSSAAVCWSSLLASPKAARLSVTFFISSSSFSCPSLSAFSTSRTSASLLCSTSLKRVSHCRVSSRTRSRSSCSEDMQREKAASRARDSSRRACVSWARRSAPSATPLASSVASSSRSRSRSTSSSLSSISFSSPPSLNLTESSVCSASAFNAASLFPAACSRAVFSAVASPACRWASSRCDAQLANSASHLFKSSAVLEVSSRDRSSLPRSSSWPSCSDFTSLPSSLILSWYLMQSLCSCRTSSCFSLSSSSSCRVRLWLPSRTLWADLSCCSSSLCFPDSASASALSLCACLMSSSSRAARSLSLRASASSSARSLSSRSTSRCSSARCSRLSAASCW
ncbi:hypothetical protein EYF80_026640 [Liparis tanakae]|uniref:Uncharacterized protein n=1 Tax=Liparis tanakae TaxID=230148 RepID=A0A4Z2HBN6_9TELE|nr:hypothetical protein EYF80_026640 [Liparis tanakae]